MTTLHAALADDFASAVNPAVILLSCAARDWADLERAGRRARAALAWTVVLPLAQRTGCLLADWGRLGFTVAGLGYHPDVLRLLDAALALHDGAALGDALTDAHAAALLGELRDAALALGKREV